ncbi:3-carboxy-cis,cis-muconate cycloisomerase [Saccharothrix algeriensis]|uniref:3-carboxy-cis,cis-muconate cycloisomerase n=1 Tax=Saccharothrix algeriensis TaxID=173560 RepID=A0A8T8I0P7_9PSEU|nr:3-carboxy-cis,cis-muconate cycloisomerase [Saccharothrix algeriensis]MBM7810006.1 3-carboxy-cis,cis-muconate cycloisomerase [Saccharothrix algeriensis]QTR04247.1 3-carboxy-cis,cis-muconate cycloisomerase [Saccharothrix algeriensis]
MIGDSGLLSPGWADTGAESLVDDRAWVAAMIAVEAALARAQERLGAVPPGVAEAIAAVDPDRFDLPALAAGVRASGNPVVAFVGALTGFVAERDPEAAEHVHRGSTSQDVLDTATMLICRSVLDRVRQDLARVADALAALAAEHRDTLMAGRTLTQHAVPMTFGLKAAGWLNAVLDCLDLLADHELPVSLGGAAGTLAAYQEATDDALDLVGPFAAELGLAAPLVPWHGSRAPVARTGGLLALVTGTLGKLAADVEVLSRTEIGELTEPSAPGRGGSSAMPQKRNPVYATAILTASRQVPALVSVLHQSMVVPDERSAGGWHAEWQPLRECLRLAAGAARNAADLTGGLTAHPDRMRANLELTGGAIVSERLTAVLAPLLGKAAAKRLLTEATRATADDPARLPEVLAERLPEHGDADHWRALCDPAGYTGASARLTDRVLARHRSSGADAR